MKKSRIILAVFFIGISIINISCVQIDRIVRIKGDGNIITSEKTLSAFENIKLSGSVTVNFHASDEYRAIISIDSNLLEYTEIITNGNTLNIGIKSGNYSMTKYVVDIYCPHVAKVSISGSGSFGIEEKMIVPTFELNISGSGKIQGNIKCDNFSAHISGSGKIYGTVECDNLSTSISGSGNINLNGSSINSRIRVSGSGHFDGYEFKTNKADINLTGSGNINIWTVDYLEANISGSGKVTYRGNPKIDFSVSGSGRLRSE